MTEVVLNEGKLALQEEQKNDVKIEKELKQKGEATAELKEDPLPCGIKDDEKLREKEEELRGIVREMGLRPWMLRVIGNNGVKEAKEVDPKIFGRPSADSPEVRQAKIQEFRQVVKKLGPCCWMVQLLKQEAEKQQLPTDEKKHAAVTDKPRMRFRQLVRKLGPAPWMLRFLNENGVPAPENSGSARFPTGSEDSETNEKRAELKQAVQDMGPKPWMMDVVINQGKAAALKASEERGSGSDASGSSDTQKAKEDRVRFRQAVKKLGPAPWMLRVLANNGVPQAQEIGKAAFAEQLPAAPAEVDADNRKELRGVIKDIGAKRWMVNIVVNQARAAGKKQNPEPAAQTNASKDVNEDRKLFQEAIRQLGPRPWMFRVLGNNGVPEAKGVNPAEFEFASSAEERCETQVRRQQFRKMVRSMGPKPWMLSDLMSQCKPAKDENTQEKRKEFRQVVRKLKPGSWMMSVLRNNGVQQVGQYPSGVSDDNMDVDEKRAELREVVKRLGPAPWMSQVIINQAAKFGTAEVQKSPATGTTDGELSEAEIQAEWEKMKKKRKAFVEVVRQMGPRPWMLRVLYNNGLKQAKDVDISAELGNATEEDENEMKEKRQEFRQMVLSTGPKPWMIQVIVNQARLAAEKEVIVETTDEEKFAEAVKTDMKNKRREFVSFLTMVKPRPWMLNVLNNHGVAAAKEVPDDICEDRSSFKPDEEKAQKTQFREMVRRLGPKPWMVNVLRNQATARKALVTKDISFHSPDSSSETATDAKQLSVGIVRMAGTSQVSHFMFPES